MSKSSTKQKYQQLHEWLKTYGPKKSNNQRNKFTKRRR